MSNQIQALSTSQLNQSLQAKNLLLKIYKHLQSELGYKLDCSSPKIMPEVCFWLLSIKKSVSAMLLAFGNCKALCFYYVFLFPANMAVHILGDKIQ